MSTGRSGQQQNKHRRKDIVGRATDSQRIVHTLFVHLACRSAPKGTGTPPSTSGGARLGVGGVLSGCSCHAVTVSVALPLAQ